MVGLSDGHLVQLLYAFEVTTVLENYVVGIPTDTLLITPSLQSFQAPPAPPGASGESATNN